MSDKKTAENDYPLIPSDDITPEARLIAVRWVENYQPCGFDIQGKQKLASDIMNYARRHNEKLSKELTELHQQVAELRSLKQSIAESKLKDYFPKKEMSFHDKVVLAIDAGVRELPTDDFLQDFTQWKDYHFSELVNTAQYSPRYKALSIFEARGYNLTELLVLYKDKGNDVRP